MSQNESIIESVKRQLVQMRNARRLSFDEAASELRSDPIFAAITEPQIEAAVAALKEEGRRNQVAEYPPGFCGTRRRIFSMRSTEKRRTPQCGE